MSSSKKNLGVALALVTLAATSVGAFFPNFHRWATQDNNPNPSNALITLQTMSERQQGR